MKYHGKEKRCFSRINDESGVALISVLILAAMIFTIGALLATRAQSSLNLARHCKERCRALCKVYSAQNDLLLGLMTGRMASTTYIPGGVVEGVEWNLYDKTIILEEGLEMVLQDSAGLISPFRQPTLFGNLLAQYGIDNKRIVTIVDSLLDWSDIDDLRHLNGAESADYALLGAKWRPRNGFPQLLDELLLIKGVEKDILESVEDELCYWKSGQANYLTMSYRLLAASLPIDDMIVEEIIKLREAGNLSAGDFMALTGVTRGENSRLYPNGLIRVEIRYESAKVRYAVKFMVQAKRDKDHPILIWERQS